MRREIRTERRRRISGGRSCRSCATVTANLSTRQTDTVAGNGTAPVRAIGILGGTFDPVHCAHIRLALEIRAALRLDSVRLMPARSPRLRDPPVASPEVRMRLLEAAIADVPGLAADGRELAHPGPTVTADTLQGLRDELPGVSLCLILGMDAVARLDAWTDFQRIPTLAHIVVVERPGAPELMRNGAVAHFLRTRRRDDPKAIRIAPEGFALFVRDVPILDISASRVRSLRSRGESIRFLVPDRVHDIIVKEDLYAHQC